MIVIYVGTLLILMSYCVLPSKVHAESSKSNDCRVSRNSKPRNVSNSSKSRESLDSSKSRDFRDSRISGDSRSRDIDANNCKDAFNKIGFLAVQDSIPICKYGPNGTISMAAIFNATSGNTTTVPIFSGCPGSQVPITSSTKIKYVSDDSCHALEMFFQDEHPHCGNVTFYRCDCVEVNSTSVSSTSRLIASPCVKTTSGKPQHPGATTRITVKASVESARPTFWKPRPQSSTVPIKTQPGTLAAQKTTSGSHKPQITRITATASSKAAQTTSGKPQPQSTTIRITATPSAFSAQAASGNSQSPSATIRMAGSPSVEAANPSRGSEQVQSTTTRMTAAPLSEAAQTRSLEPPRTAQAIPRHPVSAYTPFDLETDSNY